MQIRLIFLGPVINSIVTDGEEPLPSLSDWHDYEPNLEFDDTELTQPAPATGMCSLVLLLLSLHAFNFNWPSFQLMRAFRSVFFGVLIKILVLV